MKISACVITKNEEKNIGRWLACVKEIADEIVVVDTGSTDKTIELAEKGGARIEHFAWCDDFAAAKNYAISQCHGEWIIFLDADEYFSPNTVGKVRKVIERYQRNLKVVGIVCRLVNIDLDNNGRFINAAGQVRIFRHLPSIVYKGKVHEELFNTSGRGRRFEVNDELEIFHTGYSGSIVKKKLERNMKLLQESGADKKKENYFYLADYYYGFGDWEKARCYAEKVIGLKLRFAGQETRPHEIRLACLFKENAPEEDFKPALEQAIKLYPQAMEFYFFAGAFYFRLGKYDIAEDYLLQAEERQEKAQAEMLQQGVLSNNTERFMPLAYGLLGDIAVLREDKARAIEYFVKSLNIYAYDGEILCKLFRQLKDLPPEEIVRFFSSLYDRERDADFICQALRFCRAGKVYLYYAARAKNTAAFDRFLAAGRYDAAAAQLLEQMDGLFAIADWCNTELTLPPDDTLFTILPERVKQEWESREQ